MTDIKTRPARFFFAALIAAMFAAFAAADARAALPPEENLTPMEFLRDLDRPTADEAAMQADAESDDAQGESNLPLTATLLAAAAMLTTAIARRKQTRPTTAAT
jgi:hypothetical protein